MESDKSWGGAEIPELTYREGNDEYQDKFTVTSNNMKDMSGTHDFCFNHNIFVSDLI